MRWIYQVVFSLPQCFFLTCLFWQQVKTYQCLMSLFADSSLLTTFGVIASALKTCSVRYRYFSGGVTNWLDHAKENHGGQYSETQVESTKSLAKLFPLFAFQILYRTCVMQVRIWLLNQVLKYTVVCVYYYVLSTGVFNCYFTSKATLQSSLITWEYTLLYPLISSNK